MGTDKVNNEDRGKRCERKHTSREPRSGSMCRVSCVLKTTADWTPFFGRYMLRKEEEESRNLSKAASFDLDLS